MSAQLPGRLAPAEPDSSLGATFVTKTFPDISPNAGVIGICTVPPERAGMDDLGWHLVDFLAYKALLCGETHHRAQTWLAQCDVASIVQANPERYAYGKERRLVYGAAEASLAPDGKGSTHLRADHIKVEQSAPELKEEFLKTLSTKSKIAEKTGFPLFIIVCGLTTLEQDVFFGVISTETRLTSDDIRRSIGSNVDAVMITPALFSAGWQVNPSFGRRPNGKLRAKRVEFIARQFGGVFANEVVPSFEQWTCPLLDIAKVDDRAKAYSFPGPVMPSEEQRRKSEILKVTLHSALAGRLSSGYWDHSFNFGDESDDWITLVGPRNHKSLLYWRKKWEGLKTDDGWTRDEERLYFSGGAFGGNVRSQIAHIKYLVAESMVAWPDFWSSAFGRKAEAKFRSFVMDPSPDHIECHEMFNILEHRASSAVLADVTCDYFTLATPYEQRCRDWHERTWKMNEASPDARMAINQAYREITRAIPAVNLPPGVNFNHLSMTQKSLEVPASYLSVSLYMCFPERKEREDAVIRMIDFFKEVKDRQVELLLKDRESESACVAWLNSINMPTRDLQSALSAIKLANMPSATAGPVSNWPVLQDVEAATGTTALRAITPAAGHAIVASPPAPAPVSTDNKPVDLSTSQNTRTVPASSSKVKTGPWHVHRRSLSGSVLKQLDLLELRDIEEIIKVKRAELNQYRRRYETALPEELPKLQSELIKLSGGVAFLEAEARLKQYEKDGTNGSEQFADAIPSPAHQQAPEPERRGAFGSHAKNGAEEQDKPEPKYESKPESKLAPTVSLHANAQAEKQDKPKLESQKPKVQVDLFRAWGMSSRVKTRTEEQDKPEKKPEPTPEQKPTPTLSLHEKTRIEGQSKTKPKPVQKVDVPVDPWNQYRQVRHSNTDDEDGYMW
ncbi:hypothetical protein F4818DRAFT_247838 [Hypoxylon cercidicola]|nr:hypothetical protein F4818DRAFT_247838 [Hypoxylon cercidicola]